MNPYTVIVRDGAGREREYAIVASNSTSASNQGLLRAERESGRKDWMVVSATERFYGD